MLGNGIWLNVGGTEAVTYGGGVAPSQTGGPPYDDPDGGKSYVLSHPFENRWLTRRMDDCT